MKKENKIPMKDKFPFIDKPPIQPCQKRVEWIMNGERYTGSDCRYEANGTANRLNKQLLENLFFMADHIDEVDLNFKELEEKLDTVLENIELLSDEEFVKLIRSLMIFRKKQIPLNLKFENKLYVHSKTLKDIETEIGHFVFKDEELLHEAKNIREEIELNKEIIGNYSNENYYGDEVEDTPPKGLKNTIEVIMQAGITNANDIRDINDILNEQNLDDMNNNIKNLKDIVGKGILNEDDETIVETTLTNKILKIEENLNKESKTVEELNDIIHGEDNEDSYEKKLEKFDLNIKDIESKFNPIEEKFISIDEEINNNKNEIESSKNDILVLNSIIKPHEDDGLEAEMKWAKVQIGIEENGEYPSDSLWGSHIQLATLGNRNEQSINSIKEEIGSTKTKGIKKDVNDLKDDVKSINGRLNPLEENDLKQQQEILELTKNYEALLDKHNTLTEDHENLKLKYDDLLERVVKLEEGNKGEP